MNTRKIAGLALTICILTLIGFMSINTYAAETKDSNTQASPELPSGKIVKFVIIGDTTAKDKQGWGPGFKSFLTDRATCNNMAIGGRSSKKFIDEGRLTKALALKGDYYLIQFGHNDESAKDDSKTDPNTTYREFMSKYIDETRAIGAKPILVTSLVRRQWDTADSNKIKSVLTPYAEAARQLAKEKNVTLIDLHARSKGLYEQLGKDKANELAALKDDGSMDNTHLNDKGTAFFGKIIAEELVKALPELKPCFRFEPAADANSAAKVPAGSAH
ncbi:MAG: rhamnogalacturonan acetylesterase [Sedimentisphaerales bacterium]|jgi:pectinesterase